MTMLLMYPKFCKFEARLRLEMFFWNLKGGHNLESGLVIPPTQIPSYCYYPLVIKAQDAERPPQPHPIEMRKIPKNN